MAKPNPRNENPASRSPGCSRAALPGALMALPLVPSSAGKKELPDPQLLAERFLLRRTFEKDPQGTNLMFAFFAQHFTHQFFKTSGKMGRGFTKALGHGVRTRPSAFLPAALGAMPDGRQAPGLPQLAAWLSPGH